jgi:ferritin-like metal-binding protein YciE
VKLAGKTCAAMKGLIEEGAEIMSEDGEETVLDLAVIAAQCRIEHYEMSAYSAARDIAEALGQDEVVRLFEESLSEEEQAEQSLTVMDDP